MAEKARYWTAVMYPENMVDGWQEDIGELLQVPYAYCIHDKCMEKDGKTLRKAHLHIIIVFPNTTTYDHAESVLMGLVNPGSKAFNKIERVISIRHVYDYLIHDTEDCKKKKKHLYSPTERIFGNNFDIGAYEQLGAKEKNDIAKKLCDTIIEMGFTNFTEFYAYIMMNGTSEQFEVIKTYSGLFERLTKGNWQRATVNGDSLSGIPTGNKKA